jgi:urease alpha subunit
VRKQTPALQRGLQVNVELNGHRAAFYRVVQTADTQQIALVLLNKGDTTETFDIADYMQAGTWKEQLSGQTQRIGEGDGLKASVQPNGVQVWVVNDTVKDARFLETIEDQMSRQ